MRAVVTGVALLGTGFMGSTHAAKAAGVVIALRGAGYHGPYSVEIELDGNWPPLDEVTAAMRVAAAPGRVLMVGHVLRHVPEIVELRRVVESGELGQPLAASATRLSAPPDWNDWMLDEARSGGRSWTLRSMTSTYSPRCSGRVRGSMRGRSPAAGT